MTDPSRQDQMVDWILGEASEDAARELRRDLETDPEAALGATELRCLFEDLRELSVEPSSRIAVTLRSTVDRRARLRAGEPQPGLLDRSVFLLKVASVAAAVVVGALLYERMTPEKPVLEAEPGLVAVVRHSGPDRDYLAQFEPEPDLAPTPKHLVPVQRDKKLYPYKLYRMEAGVVARYAPPHAHLDEARPQDVWLHATNAVASLRLEFASRLSPRLRREAIRAAGGSDFLDDRIDTLASEIAQKIEGAIADASADVQDVALSLRAMMAGGSTLRIGEHQSVVRTCTAWLQARVPALHGGELATALSGLMDVAVVSGPRMGRFVGEHASRLAESIIYSTNEHRPTMLNWQTTPAQLADAGQVLRLAPAFGKGSVNKEALLARAYLATHLSERIDLATAECPDLLAAQLYGFGDLIDRSSTERKLALWHARDLVPEHYVALHHVAWSRFPLRADWADFQQELRAVSTLRTPESTSDAAALLLALTVNYAAPGSRQLLEVALR